MPFLRILPVRGAADDVGVMLASCQACPALALKGVKRSGEIFRIAFLVPFHSKPVVKVF